MNLVFLLTRDIQGHLDDAKCVTEILGDTNKEVIGTKFTFLFQEKISALDLNCNIFPGDTPDSR